jgi:RHS repeat-associated protein
MFTGQYYDSEIGQYYLRARQYDPQLMRFTGKDSIDGQFEEPMTLHKYLYCINDPINRVDLVGLWSETVHNKIIDAAFGDGRSWGTLQTSDIKYGSAYVDSSPFQGGEYAYMHAMTPAVPETVGGYGSYSTTILHPSLSKQQTIDKMVGFIITQLEQSNCNNEIGDTRLAGIHLGEAAHPLMDFTCSAHSLKPWSGAADEYIPHVVDLYITPRELRDAANFTRTTLEMLNNDTQALSGWDW